MKKLSFILFLLRVITGILFIYSGYSKLMAPRADFIGAILGYQIVGAQTASWMAAIFPWIELVAGVFFILGLWTRPALWVLWGLNAMFMVAILSALLRRIPLENCGCFGEGAKALPVQATLALDVFLFFVFFWMNRKKEEASYFSFDRFFN